MHKKMMTATNLLSELAHALRRSIGENGDQETSNKQNTNDPLQNSMEKSKDVSINSSGRALGIFVWGVERY